MPFSIFSCETGERVSDQDYATAEEANHDYYMNEGHTCVCPTTEYAKCGLSEHEMKCVGLGLPITAPLQYVAELRFPESNITLGHPMELICTLKARLEATSEASARKMLTENFPVAKIESLLLL